MSEPIKPITAGALYISNPVVVVHLERYEALLAAEKALAALKKRKRARKAK